MATWVKHNGVDCDELWAQPCYGNLLRVTVEYMYKSLDNLDVVCLTVNEDHYVLSSNKKVWMEIFIFNTHGRWRHGRGEGLCRRYQASALPPLLLVVA